ncbi:restriction endonuclease [Beggiatoa leptomitoformis]|uniref:Restriction endonuclease type IV Mrr domain-containing protein n=1 Tax=Beggiatoa leptomitoformis TaxID=288004 RepID=A0A2N9YCT2_9GAMM|nr:restriction endonuclease [Beggiatoa leptomitoformis]ALG66456.1 hypothetical protein AL038_00250 [Beggiatoa leptomitoformis]AUI68263.1 hypothetical protein BLE401_05820 [Beggiatoa leptomitoformis]
MEIKLTDKMAIEILSRFSEQERGQTAAKYIILGDAVINYAQLTTNQQSIQEHFTPITDKLVHQVSSVTTALSHQMELMGKHLEGTIPQTVSTELNKLTPPIEKLNSIATLLNQLHETLSNTISAVSKPAKKGSLSCEVIFESLKTYFRDDSFEYVSSKARFTDIVATPDSFKHRIFIEVKDYTKTVPSDEVQKFWRDLDSQQVSLGCFISLHTDISNVTGDFKIISNGSKIGVFVVSDLMGGQGHLWAYGTARKILEVMLPQAIETNQTEQAAWIANLLNNRLLELKNNVQDFEKIQNDLEKTKDTVEKSLSSVIKKITELRAKLDTTIEMALHDFPHNDN